MKLTAPGERNLYSCTQVSGTEVHMHRPFIRTCCALVAASVASLAFADTDSISIARASGSIAATAHGVKVAVRAGARFTPPVTIQTGADGTLHLEQSTASLDIGPNSFVELHDSLANARVVQRAGRVMYTVEPRKSRNFAVETPYLVSVVKGTIFTVSVDASSTQVTLLEGSVELRGDGIADAVMLQPNQSAKRAAGERSINVTTIDTRPPTQANLDRSPPSTLNNLTATPASQGDGATTHDLNQVLGTYVADQRSRGSGPLVPAGNQSPTPPQSGTPEVDQPVPVVPDAPSSPAPVGPPTTPTVPATPPSTPPIPTVPVTPPPTPTMPTVPVMPVPDVTPLPDDDDHDNGHGNDDDGYDDSNSGKGKGRKRR
jgi:hypothetical protein